MKPQIVTIMAFVLLSACKKETVTDSINAQVSSNVVTHDDLKVEYVVDLETYSPCTQEFVHFTGTGQLTYHTILMENGGYHVNAKERYLNIHGVGVTSGATYKLIGYYNTSSSFQTSEGVYKFVSKVVLATPGGKNNLVYINTINGVVDKNGEFVIFKVEGTATCQ